MGDRVETGFELGITCSDTVINYRLFQNLKLLRNGEFNYLTIILTISFGILMLLFFILVMLCTLNLFLDMGLILDAG
jgi:hypothetical protein